jgi:hypothetical protein
MPCLAAASLLTTGCSYKQYHKTKITILDTLESDVSEDKFSTLKHKR